jgi:large subunit ribosomal protein L9
LLLLALLALQAASGFFSRASAVSRASFKLRAKGGTGGGSTGVRVRFLQDVKGQGKKGEVAFVSPPLFQNVLSPQKLAERVSDEQFAQENANKADQDKLELERQTSLAQQIDALTNVQIKKKIGENGKIFGAISRKALLEHLKAQFAKDAPWHSKLSILQIKTVSSGDVSTAEGDDIRQAGAYEAKLALGHPKAPSPTFRFEVVSEK